MYNTVLSYFFLCQLLIIFNPSELPVVCLMVKDNIIIDYSFNVGHRHCEEILLNKHCIYGCDIYVTMEPCIACLFLCTRMRVKNIFFGCYNAEYGALGGKFFGLNLFKSISKPNTFGGFFAITFGIYLKNFFLLKRLIR